MAYRVDLSQTPDEILRGLINFDNKTSFTPEQLYFNAIGAVPSSLEEGFRTLRNSKVSANFNGRIKSKKTFYYNRIVLSTLLGNRGIVAPWREHVTTEELLPYVREQLGIALTKEDIVTRPIDQDAYEEHIVIFRPNLAYLGTISVVFSGHPDSLSAQLPVRDLSGFTIENIE